MALDDVDRGSRGLVAVLLYLDRRGWTGVPDVNHGLQPASGPAAGTREAGAEDDHVLATLTEHGFTRYWDGQAEVPWLYDGTTSASCSGN
jgi:GH18 family chitinase